MPTRPASPLQFSTPADYDLNRSFNAQLGFGDVRKDASFDQPRNTPHRDFNTQSPAVTPSRAQSRVYIGRIHHTTTQDQLEKLFSKAGNVVKVHIPFDKSTGRPRGYAFCQYENEEEAKGAIEMFNGYGRQLRVALAN